MKNLIALFTTLIFACHAFSQVESEKEPHYNYLTLSTSVFTNAIGKFDQKTFFTVEGGRTFGIFDIG